MLSRLPNFILPLLLGILLLGRSGAAYAQTTTLQGKIVDTASKKNTRYAIIALLKKEDSTLIAFTRSTADGSFILKGPVKGDYLLWITHPNFSPYSRPLKINHEPSINLGALSLPPKSSTLEAAVVTTHKPVVRLKGDTTEYDAANVKVKTNANVEDLLRQLPGVQVDQKGQITAQGEKVQKVLIDGEEFFSDDPTIATRNLSAAMVDKVQVLNKRSPQAEFTGIDDGKTMKTINLTLREDKKHGWFGKAETGTDGDKFYNDNALLGAFKAKRKISAFTMISNTGQSSLSGADAQNFNGEDEVSIPGVPGGGDNFGAAGATGGIPRTTNLGAHYSNKWNGDGITSGQHLSANYRYDGSSIRPSSYTYTRLTLPDTIYAKSSHADSRGSSDRHSMSGIYDLTLDSSSSLRFSFGMQNGKERHQDAFLDSTRLNDTLVNDSRRSSDAYIDNRNLIGNILWRKKYVRPGQTLSAYISLHTTDQHTFGYLLARNTFYQGGQGGDTTDQRKDNRTRTTTGEANMLYTTPLWKDWVLAAGYSLALTHNESARNTFDKAAGKYDQRVDSLSSDYAFNIATQRVRMTAQLKKKKFLYTLGGDVSYSNYRQTDLRADTALRYHYLNFFPQMQVRYNMSSFRALSFNYYGNTQQPSIYQVQPIKNNNDPLNIIEGNPGLRPSFSHQFRLGLNNYKPLAGRYLYTGISFGFVQDAFSSRSIVDARGKTTTRTVNVNGNRNVNGYISSTWKIRPIDLDLGGNAGLSYSRAVNYTQGLLDRSDNLSPSLGVSVGRTLPDKYNFSMSFNANYTSSHSSVNVGTPTHYWTHQTYVQGGITLPGAIDLNTNANYSWQEKITATDKNNSFLVWNASLDKRMLKNTLTARLAVNDLLDQATGISRSITANQYTETGFTTLRRYWMLSVIWNFICRGKPTQ